MPVLLTAVPQCLEQCLAYGGHFLNKLPVNDYRPCPDGTFSLVDMGKLLEAASDLYCKENGAHPRIRWASPTWRDVTILWKLCYLPGVQRDLAPSPSSRAPLLGFLIILHRSRWCPGGVNSMLSHSS